jgi:hypothetical protein
MYEEEHLLERRGKLLKVTCAKCRKEHTFQLQIIYDGNNEYGHWNMVEEETVEETEAEIEAFGRFTDKFRFQRF